MRIAVYAIALNESRFVDPFCESAIGEADVVVVADTGSTDDTVEALRRHTPSVYSIGVRPWRFDVARTAALALVPADVDVCVSLDMDERLVPGWRCVIEDAWTADATRLRCRLDAGHGLTFKADRIHARHGYRWHHPCHETLRPDPRTRDVCVETEAVLITHHPDPDKPRTQYLEMLRVAVQEDPSCARNAFYYGRELCYASISQEAIVELERYLSLQANWPAEQASAMRMIGGEYEKLGNLARARHWYAQGTKVTPRSRDAWCAVALGAYRAEDWAAGRKAAHQALECSDRDWLHCDDPAAWGALPYDIAAICAWHLGLHDEARRYGEMALMIEPTDVRLQQNLQWYTSSLSAV
jgi:tetratricopeptide (TPR) repeat protein